MSKGHQETFSVTFLQSSEYKTLVEKMYANQAELAICGYNRVSEEENNIFETSYPEDKSVKADVCIMDLFSLNGCSIRPTVWNKLFIKEILGDQKFNESYRISEDLLFLIDYLLKINYVVYSGNVGYYNLKRKDSSTCGGARLEDVCKTVEVDNIVYSKIKRKYPDLKHIVLAWVIQDNMGWYITSLRNHNDRKSLRKMKKGMISMRILALFNKDTYWKTRIVYFMGKF